MLTLKDAVARFGFNPLAEVLHATNRIHQACESDLQFDDLARMAKSDIVETRIYIALCEWLAKAMVEKTPITQLRMRQFCLKTLAAELSSRGFREGVLALSKKFAQA